MKIRGIAYQLGLVVAICLSNVLFPALADAAPRIFYTDINSGPNTGGENNNGTYLSLFGKGFGTDLSQVKVYVGNGEVTRYMYLGPSHGRPDVQQLSVQLGPNTSTGPIKVVVNGVSSNTDKTFTVRPGNFYFISLTGSDSTGIVNDVTHPYRTPNYLGSQLSAGDSIIVRGGSYVLNDGTNNLINNSWFRLVVSGTPTAPIAFLGYPGETVEIRHSGGLRLVGNYYTTAHWVIGNFLVTFTDCTGNDEFINLGPTATNTTCADTSYTLQGTATDVKFVNIEATGNDTYGLCSGSDSPIEIQHSQDVKLIGISIHNTSPALSETEGSHEIYLSAMQRGTEVGWNALYNIPATRGVIQVHQDSFGGACWGQKFLTNITIHDNLIHDAAGQSILLDGGTGDITLYNNLIYHQVDHRYSDVLALRGSGGALNAMVYNNTIYTDTNTAGQGFLIGIGNMDTTQLPHVTLYNNIFYLTDPNDLWYGSDWLSTSTLQAWIQGGGVTSDHNLWYGSKNHKLAFAARHELYVDPRFADPSKGHFWLRRDSPAIEKGSSRVCPVVSHDHDMNPRTKKNGYDIGAYQYQSGVD